MMRLPLLHSCNELIERHSGQADDLHCSLDPSRTEIRLMVSLSGASMMLGRKQVLPVHYLRRFASTKSAFLFEWRDLSADE